MSTYHGISVRFLGAMAVMALLTTAQGCAENTNTSAVAPSPARYAPSRNGFDYWSQHGRVVSTDDEAAKTVGFVPSRVAYVGGRNQLGRVAVVGPESDPRAPHWLIEFYDGFEFRQQRMKSPADAARAVRNQDDSDEYTRGIAKRVTVRDQKGYGWDKAVNERLETTDGDTVWVNLDYAAVYWSEGNIFYGVVSHDDVKMSELLRIAQSMKRPVASTVGMGAP